MAEKEIEKYRFEARKKKKSTDVTIDVSDSELFTRGISPAMSAPHVSTKKWMKRVTKTKKQTKL